MTTGYRYEIVHKFRGQGKLGEAEDWIRANTKGLWALEFLGMQEEMVEQTGSKSFLFHVRFKFGREDDFERFKREYIAGKPAPRTAPEVQTRKKGLFARLLSR